MFSCISLCLPVFPNIFMSFPVFPCVNYVISNYSSSDRGCADFLLTLQFFFNYVISIHLPEIEIVHVYFGRHSNDGLSTSYCVFVNGVYHES